MLSLSLLACAHRSALSEKTGSADADPPVFKQTLKGHMAELGQYMDDVYRFWDSKTMHVVSLQRLNMMIEIHDRVLDIYQDYLKKHSITKYRTQNTVFEEYLLESRRLTLELKAAIENKDDELIAKTFGDLDQNRRDAHSAFGEAL